MKKITLSVAALSLAISGFCNEPPTKQQLIKEITIMCYSALIKE